MHEFPKWKILKLNFLKKTFLSFLKLLFNILPLPHCQLLFFAFSCVIAWWYLLHSFEERSLCWNKSPNLCHTFGIRKLEYIFFSFFILFFFIFPAIMNVNILVKKIKLDEMKMKKKIWHISKWVSGYNFIQNKLLISEECGNDWQIEIWDKLENVSPSIYSM